MIQVELEHPIDGLRLYEVPDSEGIACLACGTTAHQGFAYIQPLSLLLELIQSNPSLREKFYKGRQVTLGEAAADFHDFQALEKFAWYQNERIIFQGWTREDFKQAYKKYSVHLGLPACKRPHPLTHELVEVFFAPKPGPLIELSLGRKEMHTWSCSTMQKQLYDTQAYDTVNRKALTMTAPAEYGEVLLSQAQFQRLVSAGVPLPASVAQPRPAATLPSPNSSWTAPGAHSDGAARGRLQLGTPGLLGRAPRPMGCAMAPKPAASASSSQPKPMPQKLSVAAAAPAPSSTQVARVAAKAPAVVTPLSEAAAVSRKRLGAQLCSSPVSKAPRTPVPKGSPSSETSAAAVPNHLTFRSPSAPFPAMVLGAKASTASSRDDHESIADSDLKQLGINAKDKFERARLQCPASAALAGRNMRDSLSHVKRLETMSTNSGHVEIGEALKNHYEGIRACQNICISMIFDLPLAQVFKSAQDVQMVDIKVLPEDNFLLIAARRGLEFLAPRAARDDLSKFKQIMDASEQQPNVPYAIETAQFSNDRVSKEGIMQHGPQVWLAAFSDGLFVPLVKRGITGRERLLQYAELAVDLLGAQDEAFQKHEASLTVIQQANALFVLYAAKPMHRGANIDDLERQLAERRSKLTIELQRSGSEAKVLCDGAWALHAQELLVWPQIEQALSDDEKASDRGPFLEKCVKNFPVWKTSVRGRLVSLLREKVDTSFQSMFEQTDWTQVTDTAQVEKSKALVDLARQANAVFKSAAIQDCLSFAVNFTAKVSSMDMRQKLQKGCAALANADGDEIPRFIEELRAAIPGLPGVVIVFTETEQVATATKAAKQLCQKMLNDFPTGTTIGALAVLLIESLKPGDGVDKTTVAAWEDASKRATAINLFFILDHRRTMYRNLGATQEERVDAKNSLNVIKHMISVVDKILNSGFPTLSKEFQRTEEVEAGLKAAQEAIERHGQIFVQKFTKQLLAAQAALKPIARGSADEKWWAEGLSADASRSDILKQGNATLMQLKTETLIMLIKNCQTERMCFVASEINV